MLESKEITVSNLLSDLPVTLSDKEYEKYTGHSLYNEFNPASDQEISDFLDRVHENLYYGLIYRIGGEKLKNKIIRNNLSTLTKPLKLALIIQTSYMLDTGGDWGSMDASYTSIDGTINIKSNVEQRNKIIAPKIYDILHNARPNLILGVKYDGEI